MLWTPPNLLFGAVAAIYFLDLFGQIGLRCNNHSKALQENADTYVNNYET